MPARRERSGLRLSVTDHARDHQVRIVEGRAVGVHQRIAELAALMDRPWRLGRDVTGDTPGKGELAEQLSHPVSVLHDAGVDLAVGAFQIGIGD